MKTIETLPYLEAEMLRKQGDLIFINLEEISFSLLKDRNFLQNRANELKADVVGMPGPNSKKYYFYRTNLPETDRKSPYKTKIS